ncbi:MAG: MipA/OmpV family protein, partial [Rhizobacter sp.]|nr:MipA/OmpV family protein [Rhizobacter sp.]
APIPQPQQPLWELGVGLSGLSLPHYRGSDQSHAYLLPFPYIVYRGTWLKSDRKGTRAMLLDTREVELDLSFGASAPIRNDNEAREGMPDLPGSVEVGPNLNIVLAESARERWTLDLRLPLRAAISLERSPRYVGATFSPNVNLDIRAGTLSHWNIGLLTGPLFANRRYHAPYYQVDPAYATAERPAYEARGGYAGWQTVASTSRRWGPMWLAGFVRHESLHGAVYQDSPLVRRNSALTVGFAVSWVLTTSSQTVASHD